MPPVTPLEPSAQLAAPRSVTEAVYSSMFDRSQRRTTALNKRHLHRFVGLQPARSLHLEFRIDHIVTTLAPLGLAVAVGVRACRPAGAGSRLSIQVLR